MNLDLPMISQENSAKNPSNSHNIILIVATFVLAFIVIGLAYLNTRPQPKVAVEPERLAAVISAIDEAAIPLGDHQDVDQIVRAASDKEFVLLGESSHGTSEYYLMRSAITKRLISDHQFSFVAIEGDWPYIYQLNRYVKAEPGAPNSARDALATTDRWPDWMWANQEFLQFVEWLRDYNLNLDREERVGLYGMDIQNFELSGQLLGEVDSQYPRYDQISLAHEHATEYARLIENRSPNNWNYRVRAMKSLVESLRGHYTRTANHSDPKVVVWAHNTHIGDASATEMAAQGMINIGQLLKEKYQPDSVFALGFGTYTGTVMAGLNWGEAKQVMDIPTARADSIEYVLAQHELPIFLLLFEDWEESSMANHLENSWPHRAKGVVYNPRREQFNYVASVLPERYDGFVFIRETRALTPLDN